MIISGPETNLRLHQSADTYCKALTVLSEGSDITRVLTLQHLFPSLLLSLPSLFFCLLYATVPFLLAAAPRIAVPAWKKE